MKRRKYIPGTPEFREYMRKWRLTYKGKISYWKRSAKIRHLGFKPLNKPRKGTIPHHIDTEYVVFIPMRVHNQCYHNAFTGAGMLHINEIARQYLIKEVNS